MVDDNKIYTVATVCDKVNRNKWLKIKAEEGQCYDEGSGNSEFPNQSNNCKIRRKAV
jgi:hypothetical protein